MSAVLYITLYMLSINLLTFLVYWRDKRAARHGGRYRTPEKTLLVLAFLGGSPAAYVAQRLFRHKTNKTSFRARFWLVVMLQIILLFVLASMYYNN